MVAITAAYVTIRTNRQLAREKNALDFEQKYKENPKITEHMRLLGSTFKIKNSLEIKEMSSKKYEECSEEEKKFWEASAYVLNEWERAANAVNHDIYDEHLLYKAYGTSVLKLYMNLSEYIAARQKDSVRYYINFLMLVAKWQIRRGRENRCNEAIIRKITIEKNKLKLALDEMSNELELK